MNPQELCLVLKGVPLAKESRQTAGVFASTFDKHKLNCLADHLCRHLLADGSKNEYHSMWTVDRRPCQKDMEYFADICLADGQPVERYVEYLGELGKTSPASLVIAGFEMFLKYLEPKKLFKFMEALQNLQAKNLSNP